jgi:predicted anti-sigma-YlaC factor YlaD
VTPPADLACRELVELATDHLEDALSALDAARVDAHLDECPDCAEYIAQIRRTIEVMRWALA